MGELARRLGDYPGASGYFEECLRVAQGTGDRLRIAMQYDNLGMVAYRLNQPYCAAEMSRRGIQLFREMGNVFGAVTATSGVAGSALLLGAPDRAARLLGAANALLDDICARYQLGDQYEADHLIEETRRRLGEAAFQTAWEAGAAMSFEEAIAYTLREAVPAQNDPGPKHP